MSVDIYQIIYKGPFSDTSKPIMLIKVGENYHRSNSVSGLIGKNCFCLQCEKGFDHDSKFYKTFETWSWRYRFESSPYYYFAQRWIFQKTSWMVTELFLNLGVMIQSIILLKKNSSRLKPSNHFPMAWIQTAYTHLKWMHQGQVLKAVLRTDWLTDYVRKSCRF